MSAPATIYADPAQFEAWLDAAAPGESFLYAVAPALDPAAPIVAAVKRARDAGAVVPVMGGRAGERRFQVQRAARPVAPPGSPERALPRLPRAFAATPEGALFALLAEIADAGLPCPSNAALARRLAWDDREQVRYRLRRLEAEGRITIRALGDRFAGRIVTITETGARTAPPTQGNNQA